jgi:hypothetical protein
VAMRAYVPNEQVFNSHSTRNPSPQPNPHTPNPFHHPNSNPRVGYAAFCIRLLNLVYLERLRWAK